MYTKSQTTYLETYFTSIKCTFPLYLSAWVV